MLNPNRSVRSRRDPSCGTNDLALHQHHIVYASLAALLMLFTSITAFADDKASVYKVPLPTFISAGNVANTTDQDKIEGIRRIYQNASELMQGLDEEASVSDIFCPIQFEASTLEVVYDKPNLNNAVWFVGLPQSGEIFSAGQASPGTTPFYARLSGSILPGGTVGIDDPQLNAHELGHALPGQISDLWSNHPAIPPVTQLDEDRYNAQLGTVMSNDDGTGPGDYVVSSQLCDDWVTFATTYSGATTTAQCMDDTGSEIVATPRLGECADGRGYCDGEGHCLTMDSGCVAYAPIPKRGSSCDTPGFCRVCSGHLGQCVPCDAQVATGSTGATYFFIGPDHEGTLNSIYRLVYSDSNGADAEIDLFKQLSGTIRHLTRDHTNGDLYTLQTVPPASEKMIKISPNGSITDLGALTLSPITDFTWVPGEGAFYGIAPTASGFDLYEISGSPLTKTLIDDVEDMLAIEADKIAYDSYADRLLVVGYLGAVEIDWGGTPISLEYEFAFSTPAVLDVDPLSGGLVGVEPGNGTFSRWGESPGISGLISVDPSFPSFTSTIIGDVDVSDFVAAPICGNSTVEVGEQCDDGNYFDGDGCSTSCRTVTPDSEAIDDDDSDGVDNWEDNCPAVANSGQKDRDGDYFGDVCDICPRVYDELQLDSDEDGFGDACDSNPTTYDEESLDSDGDGIADESDKCPLHSTADPDKIFPKDASQTDTDGDGVGDVCDNCLVHDNGPNEMSNQVDVDSDGFGNACDPDYDDSLTVTTTDFGFFQACLSNPSGADCNEADHDGSGSITITDYSVFLRHYQSSPPVPGPSGLSCAGTAPCTE